MIALSHYGLDTRRGGGRAGGRREAPAGLEEKAPRKAQERAAQEGAAKQWEEAHE